MIIIGEKINGAIPSVKKAIAERDAEFIKNRAIMQDEAGATYIDCCPATEAEKEYDAMVWTLNLIQEVSNKPIAIDSPDEKLLARIYEEGLVNKPGMINSVNEEGTKCETIFPLIAGTEWEVVGLTCDQDGIPMDPMKKIDIAKRMIDKADKYGVDLTKFHVDPCVMALSTAPTAMEDMITCIKGIHEYAPSVKVTGAVSNISFEMPVRKLVNYTAMTLAIGAGLNSAIIDPCEREMMGAIFAAEALCQIDKAGRKYNQAYRKGKIGPIKK